MLDVYSWILSPEIREYLRKKHPLSVMEKEDVIIHAYRPLEEKLAALQELLDEAGGKEREMIEDMIRLYRFAIREIHELKPGELYLVQTEDRSGNSSPDLLDSYEMLEKRYNLKRSEIIGPFGTFYVQKWGPLRSDGELKPLLSFSLSAIEDSHLFSITDFRIEWVDFKSEGISQGTVDRYYSTYPSPDPGALPLPFTKGDLLRVDVPFNSSPSYAPNGTPIIDVLEIEQVLYCPEGLCYHTLHYISEDTKRFEQLNLTDGFIGNSKYRVIDWVHKISPSDLPAGHEVLGEVSRRVKRLNRSAAEKLFYRVFDWDKDRNKPPHYVKDPYYHIPKTLDELLSE